MTARKTALLLILDGLGHREATDSNAISAANSPTWDTLWRDRPHTLVRTSGLAVGLPEGQMGNSEVGHMNLGAGRVVYQNLTRIDKDIADGSFVHNPVLTRAVDTSIERNSALHVFGLLSPGGIHSHEDQIVSMLELALARGANQVFFHAFLDGRDTPPRSALASLLRVETLLTQSGCGIIASLCGRFFSMDRDNRWERVEPAYDLLTRGEAEFTFATVETALAAAYSRGEDDEFVKPTIVGETAAAVKDDDVVVFMNFRSDRAR